MKLNKSIVSVFFAICPFFVFSQFSKPEIYLPDNEKYIYPINPGQPGSLAGTMGELRTTHFHSGIDIRTNNQIGFPVLASKSGYISRVSVSPSGYGNIIYIAHPDGNTTLYAHLNNFKGALADHVIREQYKRKTFALDLYFLEDQFPVRQGDTIAISGNTGSSGGPHLHFDIRDRNFHALDPLKVANFPEIPDNLPPSAEKIALRTLDKNSRINDRFGRFEFHALAKSKSHYTIASPILANGVIGIELIAKDRLAPGSPFYGGVNYIEVELDSQLVFRQAIEKINTSEPRSIYTIMDFKTMRNRGTRFYKLFIDDGNSLDFYKRSPGDGKIRVNPDRESSILIRMSDSYNNTSTVSFKVRPVPVVKEVRALEALSDPLTWEINENILMVTARPCSDSSTVVVHQKGRSTALEPDYFNANRAVYLVDLRKSFPDSITTCNSSAVTDLKQIVPPDTQYTYYSDIMDIEFPKGSLYDTLYLTANYKYEGKNETFSFGDRLVPLNKYVSVVLKPQQTYQRDSALAVYRVVGRGYAYVGGKWENDQIRIATREFGEFTLLKDTVPPAITVRKADRSSLRFKISDNLSGIRSYDAYVNGEWVLMHYDAKSATIWSEKLNRYQSLAGDLELVVTDNAGNKSTFRRRIP